MLDAVPCLFKDFHLLIISKNKPNTHNTTFTFTGMVGHSYYHPRKDSTLTSTDIVGHTYYHPGKASALTSTGMVGHTYYHPGRAHVYHFPLEGTLI